MIAYDDLVSALQSWRGKQGLPVSGAVASGAGSGSGPARAAPPVAPPRRAPSVVESIDDADYVEEAPPEEGYEAAGVRAGIAYDDADESEATAIGDIPGQPGASAAQPSPRTNDDQADW